MIRENEEREVRARVGYLMVYFSVFSVFSAISVLGFGGGGASAG